MKKILSVFLAGTLALSFASCDKNKSNNEPINEGTTTALRFVVSEAQTRTLTDGQNDVNGVKGESKVKDGLFLTLGANNKFTNTTTVPIGTGADEATWESEVVKYTGTTGPQRATLMLNAPASATTQITDADQTISIDNLAELTATTGFTMTGTTNKTENNIDIQKGLDKTTVETGTTEAQNNFAFTVERVSSKAQVSMEGKDLPLTGDLAIFTSNSLSEFRYAVAGSAKKVYLFADHAGERTLKADKYADFKSAIHGNELASNASGTLVPRADIQKVSDLKLVAPFATEAKWETLNSLPIKVEAADAYQTTSHGDAGIFFLENSVSDAEINAKGQLKYNDITYVKVYAKFNPGKVIKIEDDGTRNENATVTDAVNTYNVSVTNEYHDAHPGLTYTGAEDSWMLSITDQAGTFYRGANGKLYFDLKSARADKNPTSMKYSSGKMVWLTPANNQIEGDDDAAYTKYADTRRNNIYSIKLTGISGFGKNYDPIDPKDPNLDNPEDNPNPDEPTVDPIVPVDPAETYIQVKATILKWNLVHRGVVLK